MKMRIGLRRKFNYFIIAGTGRNSGITHDCSFSHRPRSDSRGSSSGSESEASRESRNVERSLNRSDSPGTAHESSLSYRRRSDSCVNGSSSGSESEASRSLNRSHQSLINPDRTDARTTASTDVNTVRAATAFRNTAPTKRGAFVQPPDTVLVLSSGVRLGMWRSDTVETTLSEETSGAYGFVPGFRRGSVLMFEVASEQLFRCTNTYDEFKRYRCIVPSCSITLRLEKRGGVVTPLSEQQVHGHPPNDVKLGRDLFMHEVKSVVLKSDGLSKPGDVFESVGERHPEAYAEVNYNAARGGLAKCALVVSGDDPKTVKAVKNAFQQKTYMDRYGRSLASSHWLFYRGTQIDENNGSFTVFASTQIIAGLGAENELFVDGTFDVVPLDGQYAQLIVIHLGHGEHSFPFLFILTTNRTQELYARMLRYVEANVCRLRPKSIMMDYERAMRLAIREVYPNTTLRGCLFHYTQAVKRKAGRKMPGHSRSRLIRKMLGYAKALPLLPASQIMEGFEVVKKEATVVGPLAEPFIAYVEKQWLSGRRESPESISVYKLSNRTNNLVENYNGRLSAKLGKHKSFGRFVTALRREEHHKATQFSQVLENRLRVFDQPKKSYIARNNRIEKAQRYLERGRINVGQFLEMVAERKPTVEAENVASTSESEEESHDPQLCLVCKSTARTTLLLPCSHFVVCDGCAVADECPTCNTSIANRVKLVL